MRRPELSEEPNFRSLVVRVADEPNGKNHAALCRALPAATVFVKLVGVRDPTAHGEKYVVPKGGDARIRYVRLPNGMQMVRASAAPPRDAAADEVVATMTGMEILRMVTRMPVQGLLIAAEDDRNSWTAITQDGITSILNSAGAR